MSEAAAKATRRQLRRAIGDVAGAALTEQSSLTAKHDRLLASHSERLQTLTASLQQTNRVLREQDEDFTAFVELSFLGRLRWLVMGTRG